MTKHKTMRDKQVEGVDPTQGADPPQGVAPLHSGIQRVVRALRHRNFRLFFGGQLISLSGTWMQQIAIGWLVYRLTASPLILGLVAFSGQGVGWALPTKISATRSCKWWALPTLRCCRLWG